MILFGNPVLTGNPCRTHAAAVPGSISLFQIVVPVPAKDIVLAVLLGNGFHRASSDAGSAAGTVFHVMMIFSGSRRQLLINDTADQPVCRSPSADETPGQTKGPVTADKGCMSFRPDNLYMTVHNAPLLIISGVSGIAFIFRRNTAKNVLPANPFCQIPHAFLHKCVSLDPSVQPLNGGISDTFPCTCPYLL